MSEQKNLISQLFSEMPSPLRFILLAIMLIPLSLAMSGVILQLNVGKLIEQAIQHAYDVRDDKTASAIEGLSQQITAIQLSLQAQEMKQGALTERVDDIELNVKRLNEWACGHQRSVGPKEFTTNICE